MQALLLYRWEHAHSELQCVAEGLICIACSWYVKMCNEATPCRLARCAEEARLVLLVGILVYGFESALGGPPDVCAKQVLLRALWSNPVRESIVLLWRVLLQAVPPYVNGKSTHLGWQVGLLLVDLRNLFADFVVIVRVDVWL